MSRDRGFLWQREKVRTVGFFLTLRSRTEVARTLWRATSPAEKPGVVWVAWLVILRSIPTLRPLVPAETWLRLGGTRFRVGLAQAELGTWCEIWQHRAYERFPEFVPRPGWTVIDAGANIGFFTVRASSLGARVLSFEPNPRTFRRLRRNIKANRLGQRVQTFNFAVGASNETGWIKGDTISTVAMAVSKEQTGNMPVTIRTLDSVIAPLNLPIINLLKVDVEGAEVEVLCGATEALKRCQRVVMEYHSDALRDEVTALLTGCGFRARYVEGGYGYFERTAAE